MKWCVRPRSICTNEFLLFVLFIYLLMRALSVALESEGWLLHSPFLLLLHRSNTRKWWHVFCLAECHAKHFSFLLSYLVAVLWVSQFCCALMKVVCSACIWILVNWCLVNWLRKNAIQRGWQSDHLFSLRIHTVHGSHWAKWWKIRRPSRPGSPISENCAEHFKLILFLWTFFFWTRQAQIFDTILQNL